MIIIPIFADCIQQRVDAFHDTCASTHDKVSIFSIIILGFVACAAELQEETGHLISEAFRYFPTCI